MVRVAQIQSSTLPALLSPISVKIYMYSGVVPFRTGLASLGCLFATPQSGTGTGK